MPLGRLARITDLFFSDDKLLRCKEWQTTHKGLEGAWGETEGPTCTPLSILTSDSADSSLDVSVGSSVGNWVDSLLLEFCGHQKLQNGYQPNRGSYREHVSQAGG